MTDSDAIIQIGDVYTMSGCYKRRTFWQWLKRQRRELQRFRVTGHVTVDGVYEEDGDGF